MSQLTPTRTLTFRCPRELEGRLPPPVMAAAGLPDWVRSMPAQAYSAILSGEDDTVKRCPPFIDAMTSGFLMPLMCDVTVKDGEFSWDNDLPAGGSVAYARSPIGFHDATQVAGTPLFDADRFLLKFMNLWTIQAPPGYALLITHPVNRPDLPFTTLTGLVDADRFHETWINFPAYWREEGFEGVLAKGTPVAQIFPIRREIWTLDTAAFTEDETQAAHELTSAITREKGVYRRQFRA